MTVTNPMNKFNVFVADHWDEDIETSLMFYFRPPVGDKDHLVTRVCTNLTAVCEGFNKEEARSKKDEVCGR